MTLLPSTAEAARVVVMGAHGRATVRNDPFVTGPAAWPAPGAAGRTFAKRRPRKSRG